MESSEGVCKVSVDVSNVDDTEDEDLHTTVGGLVQARKGSVLG